MIHPMMMRGRGAATGLFLVRLAVGAIFLAHGLSKLQNIEGTISFFGSLGLAAFFAYLVAIVEALGGVAMILGIFTSFFGMALAIISLVAIILVKMKGGLTGPGGFELELLLFASTLGIALGGPGRCAIGPKHCGCCKGGKCKGVNCPCHMFCGSDSCNDGSCKDCGHNHEGTCENCSTCKSS